MKPIINRSSLVALFFIFVLSFVVGCLPTYVGDPETAKIDPQFVGLWHSSKDGNNEIWVVHQMNEHNYMAQGYFIKPGTDGKPSIDSSITARAWLKEIGSQTFVSMETYSAGLFTDPASTSKVRYLVASVSIDKDKMTIAHIAPDFLKDKPLAKPEDLEQVIAENLKNKDLYLEPAMYTRINPKSPGALKDLLDLIQ